MVVVVLQTKGSQKNNIYKEKENLFAIFLNELIKIRSLISLLNSKFQIQYVTF
jgi:hypothetical protein